MKNYPAMDFPKFTIITPSFNQGVFLEATITSVLAQNYPNLEYFVIDGGSTDSSADIIKKYSNQIAFWVSEKDRGQSHAFNKGLQKATGEIVGWINSDDIYYDGVFEEAVAFFEDHPDVDFVFSDYKFIDENDILIKTRKEIPFDYEIYRWTKNCYHANCAGFFRKRCFDRVGGLREDLQFGMDYELYLRFGKAGLKSAHKSSFWGGYRLHSMSKTILASAKQKMDAETIYKEYSEEKKFKALWILYYKLFRLGKKLLSGCYW